MSLEGQDAEHSDQLHSALERNEHLAAQPLTITRVLESFTAEREQRFQAVANVSSGDTGRVSGPKTVRAGAGDANRHDEAVASGWGRECAEYPMSSGAVENSSDWSRDMLQLLSRNRRRRHALLREDDILVEPLHIPPLTILHQLSCSPCCSVKLRHWL